MKRVQVYTDGACSGNPGPGGWGAVLRYNGVEKELSGGERETTNNRMELCAVIFALEALKEPCEVELYSDSQYVCNALKLGWAKKWQAQGWKARLGKEVAGSGLDAQQEGKGSESRPLGKAAQAV